MATTMMAGGVAIEIIGKDVNFQQAIHQSMTRVQQFQNTIQNFGTTKIPGFQGIWASLRDGAVMFASLDALVRRYVIAPLRSAVLEFSNFGDAYAKMARRTGMSANDLSLLGFAAEQSGSNIAELGNGMRVFQKNLAEAGRGNKSALQYFERIGIDFEKLQTLSKKDQFLAVAEHIKRLGDETLQTDAAMKLFGRGGTALLPLFQEGIEGIGKLMDEAEFNGIGISDEDAAKSEVLNDSINRVKRSLQGLRLAFVSSLAEPISKAIDMGTQFIRKVREIISINQSAVRSLLTITSASLIATAAFTGWRFVAPMFASIFNVLKNFGTVFLRLAPMLMSFISPWGLIRLAIIGVIGAIGHFSSAGSRLFGWIKQFTTYAKTSFNSAFGDIVSLVQENRIADAFRLMFLKIQLQFEEGKLVLINKFNGIAAAIIEPFFAITDFFSSILTPIWEWVSSSAAAVANYISNIWNQNMGWLGEILSGWWSYIAQGWNALQNDLGSVIVGGWWTIATGINESIAFVRNVWNDFITVLQTSWLNASKTISKGIGWIIAKLSGLDPKAVINEIEQDYKTQINGVVNRNDDKKQNIDNDKKRWQNYFDEMASKSMKRVENAPKTNTKIDAIKLEIEKLRQAPLEVPVNEKVKEVTEIAQQAIQKTESGTSRLVSGTFNKHDVLGGALSFMAAEKKDMADIADNTEETVAQLRDLNENIKNGGMVYS